MDGLNPIMDKIDQHLLSEVTGLKIDDLSSSSESSSGGEEEKNKLLKTQTKSWESPNRTQVKLAGDL